MSATLFLWTVELLHLLTHLRPGLRHFSLLRHNPHCSTRLCTMARYKCIDRLIDWMNLFIRCFKKYFGPPDIFEYVCVCTVYRAACFGSVRSEGLIRVGWETSGLNNALLTDTIALLCFAVTCVTFIRPSLINSALFVNTGLSVVASHWRPVRHASTEHVTANQLITYAKHVLCFPLLLVFLSLSLNKKIF